MKSIFHILVVSTTLIVPACSTNQNFTSAKVSAAQKAFNSKCRAIDAQTESEKKEIVATPGGLSIAESEILKARLDSLCELKKQKAEIDARFQMLSAQNLGKADRIGFLRTGLGWSGLVAGIGAAALTAACPANAVWIAVLSGYSGGIAGMNTILENNGLSRNQIAQLASAAVREFNEVNIKINFGELTICAATTSQGCTGSDWEKKFAEQQALVSQLQGILYGLDVPTLSMQDTTTLAP